MRGFTEIDLNLKRKTYQHHRVVVAGVEDLQLLIDEEVHRIARAFTVCILAFDFLVARHEDV